VRVLVTGSAGMLGHALQESRPPAITLLEADLPEVDVTDPVCVERVLDQRRPQAVINAAAYTDVDGCESHEEIAMAVNGLAVGHLARACAARELPLLQVSTDYVFDGRIPAPGEYAEEDATDPLSAYGRTKLAGEQALRAAWPRHWIVRTQWLYGLHGRNFVETMLRLAAERDELAVVDDQVGSPTSTHHLAPVLWRLVQERPPWGTYHATNSGHCSWYEFAAEIFRQAGCRVRLGRLSSDQLDRPAPRPSRSVLSHAKLEAALGLSMASWQEALADYLTRRGAAEVSSP
jgi:dTDP-4-dehydrorhamnose reductase